MYSITNSGCPLGIDGMLVSVEADISNGLPCLSLVGYLASSVREAGDRVRTALRNSGYSLPPKRITVSLSPADVRKDGAGYDLAIAAALLCSMEIIPSEGLEEYLFLGELGLDGSVRGIPGVLPVAHFASEKGIKKLVVPETNVEEASCIEGILVYGVSHLYRLILFLNGDLNIPAAEYHPEIVGEITVEHDMAEIRGQRVMKHGMEIAVAGFHNILLAGAAGAGKSLLAKCLPGIMPPMTYTEQLELTKIYSVAGLLPPGEGLMRVRPFRSPHTNVSLSAMLGGGSIPKPGEVSLASHGVLFLDEFPEYSRGTIESLRGPLEDKVVTVSRVRASYSFPAKFMLVAARNHCPCGYYPDRMKCRCTERQIADYQNRVSHPIMDRIDIRIEVRPVGVKELLGENTGENSGQYRRRICAARERQLHRYRDESFHFNSELPQKKLGEYIRLDDGNLKRLQTVYEQGELSARGYFKVLRLARTIADLADKEEIGEEELTEALFFRNVAEESAGGGDLHAE